MQLVFFNIQSDQFLCGYNRKIKKNIDHEIGREKNI